HSFIMSLMVEAKNKCGVEILDPLPYLCDEDACYGDKNGWPVYFDDDHLSESGNKLLVPMFRSIFE
ncbi:MAG TPA: SGNH hydrolase domain-containing protein, partial [Cellvibrionaceae bacterium]|nr:SGNH hydrolase domain-containing protein [Cellvibrionaceae bacterium]